MGKKDEVKEKCFMLKQSQIDAIRNEAKESAVSESFIAMMGLSLMVLRDHYGFGKKRMPEFGDYLLGLYESVRDGRLSFDDLLITIKEEADYEFTIEKRLPMYSGD